METPGIAVAVVTMGNRSAEADDGRKRAGHLASA